jgi:hypothetical protein
MVDDLFSTPHHNQLYSKFYTVMIKSIDLQYKNQVCGGAGLKTRIGKET